MIKPRPLRYLRLNDNPPYEQDDLTLELPVEVIDLEEWFEFCQKLSQDHNYLAQNRREEGDRDTGRFLHHKNAWECELLTIDFNFKDDQSGPWFPLEPNQDPRIYNADFLKDANLAQLRWPDSLVVNEIGPNTGLLIGSHLVAVSAYRDIPCGVAFHTYHKGIVIYDMPSAMLATQMFLASGVDIPTRNLRETMSTTIELVRQSFKQPALGLGTAAARFRHAFLQRAGAAGLSHEGEIRLWVEAASLSNLLDLFQSAESEQGLNSQLAKFGLEFYDRNGSLHSIDLRSMFLDRLIYRTEEEHLANVRKWLPLADVKPAGAGQTETGVIWQFIETLVIRTPSNIAPVMNFFRDSDGDSEPRSINLVVKREIHRLLALIFAWLDLFAEGWFADQSMPYDTLKRQFGGRRFATLIEQIAELLRIYDLTRHQGWKDFDPKADFVPLTDKKNKSLLDVVREHGSIEGSPLYFALRYDESDSASLNHKRLAAVEHLLAVAARWRCVEVETNQKATPTGRYRLKRTEVPVERPGGPDPRDVAQRLGFNLTPKQDPSKQLGRIIRDTPGFEQFGVKDFLLSLTERPLPKHLKWLGWEFMEKFWGPGTDLPLPDEAWPTCLSEVGPEPGQTKSLVEWKRSNQKREEAARAVQTQIMRPKLEVTAGRYKIWCWRRSAESVGGDYYHVKEVRKKDYRVYVGDASGTGLPAALLIRQIHGVITALEELASPAQLCGQLNTRLYEQTLHEDWEERQTNSEIYNQWASLVCASLDTHSNRFIFANAGHPPPILVRKDGFDPDFAYEKTSPSLALGKSATTLYTEDTIDVLPGDRLVLFTDGVSGLLKDELPKCIVENRKLGAAKLGEMVIGKLSKAKSYDDQTIIVISVE